MGSPDFVADGRSPVDFSVAVRLGDSAYQLLQYETALFPFLPERIIFSRQIGCTVGTTIFPVCLGLKSDPMMDHPSLGRICIICCKAGINSTVSASRRYQPGESDIPMLRPAAREPPTNRAIWNAANLPE
jgi:hypothetical protein